LAIGVDKSLGDLIGVCGYAVMMGSARIIYSKFADRIPQKTALFVCAVLTLLCYFAISLSKSPIIGLAGCILCGFSVGIFWPCTFSLATSKMPGCTTSMFALLSLAGDIGCTTGPTVAGFVADTAGGNLKIGILVSAVFPLFMLAALSMLALKKNKVK
jgi:MFS family permease